MRLLLLTLCLSMAGCAVPESAPETPLFADKKWVGPIWIPASADFEEFAAAQSLATACEQVTGVRPEVKEESADGESAGPGIFLGRTRAAREAGVVAPQGDGDTAVRRRSGDKLYLIGNTPVATAIVSGRFCEQALGVVFVMPGVDGVDFEPKQRIDWPESETWRPHFAWRAVSGLDDAESIEWGRRVGFGERPACTHGLYSAFDQKLHKERPELFPLVGGERQAPLLGGRSAQPNLAHADAPAVAAAHAKRWLVRNPRSVAVPMGINDSLVYDEGPEAQAKGLFEGRPNRSDYVFGFLNRVAALDWSPGADRALGCLAYLDTLAAPSFPVAPEVFPAICADRIQYADPRFAALESANLAAWGRSGARRLGTWDYFFGRDVVIPRFHLGALGAAVRAQHAAKITSWYAELDPLWAYDAPKAWVAAKLLDNPSANPTALADQWAKAAYGPAAPAMRDLQRDIERVWADVASRRRPGQWLIGWRDGCSAADLLSPALEQDAAAKLRAAQVALAAAPRDARHNRMRGRLEQFIVVWSASVAEARRCRLANAIGAESSDQTKSAIGLWQEMLAVEVARDQAQAKLNRNLGSGSQPVKWSASVQPNPWPLLAAKLSPGELAALSFTSEVPAAARLAVQIARQPSASRVIAARGLPGKEWTERVAPPATRQSSGGYLAMTAPQGRLFRRLEVAPGEILRVVVNAEAQRSFAEGIATLTVRFPETTVVAAPRPLHAPAPPPVSRTLPYAVRIWGRTVLEVPVGETAGKVAEVEIFFTDGLPPVRDVTIERLSLRR